MSVHRITVDHEEWTAIKRHKKKHVVAAPTGQRVGDHIILQTQYPPTMEDLELLTTITHIWIASAEMLIISIRVRR